MRKYGRGESLLNKQKVQLSRPKIEQHVLMLKPAWESEGYIGVVECCGYGLTSFIITFSTPSCHCCVLEKAVGIVEDTFCFHELRF